MLAESSRRGEAEGRSKLPDPHRGHRFPAEIIAHAVWLYHVFSLSLRDVELLLAERGVIVSYESVRRWCLKFGRNFADKLRRRRPQPGDTWHLDEVFCGLTASGTISGVRSTSTASCSTFWCKIGGMPRLPNASSSACFEGFDTDRGASSLMAFGVMEWRNGKFCRRFGINRADTSTTAPRTRIGRRADVSGKCNASNRRTRRSGFSQLTASSMVTFDRAVT